ncbi:MAG: hypothetical protein MZV64_71795 [Ignavibacteriales bacterium]|nr:hypothetical protein [Ignavibacteriales bacterium]
MHVLDLKQSQSPQDCLATCGWKISSRTMVMNLVRFRRISPNFSFLCSVIIVSR